MLGWDIDPPGHQTLVSVIVPVHNAASTIEAQLEALARQDYTGDWELIVVDNGSTDRSVAIAEAWRHTLPGLSILRASERRGPAHARNVGARHARGQLLAFVDADDVVAASWLAAMIAAAQRWDLVAGELRTCSERIGSSERRSPQMHPEFGFPRASTANLAVWRSLHERLGGFDESFIRTQDDDYAIRAYLAGAAVGFAADALVYRRPRRSARSTFRQHMGYGMGTVHLYAKHRGSGLRRRSGRVALNVWTYWIARTPIAMASTHGRVAWALNVGKSLGRLAGSVRYRVWAP